MYGSTSTSWSWTAWSRDDPLVHESLARALAPAARGTRAGGGGRARGGGCLDGGRAGGVDMRSLVQLQRRCACGGSSGLTASAPRARRRGCSARRRRPGHSSHRRLSTTCSRSPGRRSSPVCGAMEARFGHDFSRVRVHTDARAAESARAVGAAAYTVGRDVVFDAGRYAPARPQGRRPARPRADPRRAAARSLRRAHCATRVTGERLARARREATSPAARATPQLQRQDIGAAVSARPGEPPR